ncbi:TetR/AcrR family transcriptional regulator [Actinoallomurus sp. CA-150999]|uniref:TetR/AcrR family transcriptional regulator n=1 Tax=Actinoallomurus sp. CA-150999 TaxID=3239887 RepID=UPI003D8B9EB4
MADRLSPRARQIVAAARELLEKDGADALTMRRLADRLGIRAPSLYKHFPDKAAVEAELIAEGMEEMARALEAAETAGPAEAASLAEAAGPAEAAGQVEAAGPADVMAGLGAAYRAYARAHPHLYRLMTTGPLPRDLLPPGLEDRTAMPLVRVVGDPDRARAAWAFAHGMVMLELDGRFPPGADLDPAWRAGLAALVRPV